MPQLFSGALVILLAFTAACSRDEARQEAREAAVDARAAAERAGEQLADSWLTTKIQAQYFADEDIKARHVNVATRDGAVTLTGYVEDERAREQAVQIARNTDGVRGVEDRLTIGRAPSNVFDSANAAGTPAPGADTTARVDPAATTGAVPTSGRLGTETSPAAAPLDDAAIVTRIQSKYFLDDAVKARQIHVEARQGVVTLRGEVASEAERGQALVLARTMEGVQRVEDSLTVNALLEAATPPPPPDTALPEAPRSRGAHDAPGEP